MNKTSHFLSYQTLAILIISAALFLTSEFTAYATQRALSRKPVSPYGKQVTGDQWLFVIGIDNYLSWPRLITAVNDAKAVKDILLSRYSFDKKHLIELYDENATRRNILKQLRYLAKTLKPDDSLIIFYAGHGHLDSITKAGSWIPIESDVTDTAAWISNHDIKNYLKVDAIKAKHVLLISDSCFSGDFFRGHRGKLPEVTSAVIKKAYKLTSRQAISSGGLEPVTDAGFANHSVFSHFLLQTLRDNRKPFLVPSDFFPEVKAGVAENAEQFPRIGSLSGTGGQQGGEIVLFLKQDSRLKDLSADAKLKTKELEHLKKLEKEDRKARAMEAAEIAKQEKEVAALDAQLAAMRKRLGTSNETADDSLDGMLAMVREKEKQQKRIDELKKQRQAEEAKRKNEIERMKFEQQIKKIDKLREEILKYEEIVSSPFGKDMKEVAWKKLLGKYPKAKDIETGDTSGLLEAMGYKTDGRFFTYDGSIIIDTSTDLMWAAKDNYEEVSWHAAKRYCENYRSGGYSNWRMPTSDELASLYDNKATQGNYNVHLTELLQLSGGFIWASETRVPDEAAYFNFYNGKRFWQTQLVEGGNIALPVKDFHRLDHLQATHYKVRRGDSLWNITRRYGTTPKKIQELNNLKSAEVHIGQILKLPKSANTRPKNETTTSSEFSVKEIDKGKR